MIHNSPCTVLYRYTSFWGDNYLNKIKCTKIAFSCDALIKFKHAVYDLSMTGMVFCDWWAVNELKICLVAPWMSVQQPLTHTLTLKSASQVRGYKGGRERVLLCACLSSSVYCKRAFTPPLVSYLHICLIGRVILSLSLPTASCYSWPLMSVTLFSFLAPLTLTDGSFFHHCYL